MKNYVLLLGMTMLFLTACKDDEGQITPPSIDYAIVAEVFEGRIDLENLDNYADQDIPDYIDKDNTEGNVITDAGATLGRVLFYDKNLSVDNAISCSSCHKQAFAFSDDARASVGVAGTTTRHSMRLVNTRFSDEVRFFWDERANTLEEQTTMPIQDHVEMGFSGQGGNPGFGDLANKLESIEYYEALFEFVYGDTEVTEDRVQQALAQFIRSIQSFDSKYDEGRNLVNNNIVNFSNFTADENAGKELFMQDAQFNISGERIGGGLGCDRCHRAPEFDITPNSRNNGVISTIAGGPDVTITRSPSLRDLKNSSGQLNGAMMHDGSMNSINVVLTHYDQIRFIGNNNLDPRLIANGNAPQNLMMTDQERTQVIAFMETLTGNDMYTNEKWSDPF